MLIKRLIHNNGAYATIITVMISVFPVNPEYLTMGGLHRGFCGVWVDGRVRLEILSLFCLYYFRRITRVEII